jgi:hypothetical protein
MFTLPGKYIGLAAGDVVQIADIDGGTHLTRLTSVDPSGDLRLKCSAVGAKASGVLSTAIGATTAGYTKQTPIALSPVIAEYLDIPSLNDADTVSPILYATADTAISTWWKGALVYQQDDAGIYQQVESISDSPVIGYSIVALDDAPTTTTWDLTSSVQVQLTTSGDTLTSATEAELWANANTALIGNEIFKFKTVVDDGNGRYTLSTLIRGRFGTEWASEGHATGERFVLLSEGGIYGVTQREADIDTTLSLKALPVGGVSLDYGAKNVAYTGENMMPRSPVDVQATQDVSLNLDIVWTRRTRLFGTFDLNGYAELGETTEDYEVDILNGATVVRTLTSITTEYVEYARADQVTDFGAGQTTCNIVVYQLSSVVGRGRPSETLVATIG